MSKKPKAAEPEQVVEYIESGDELQAALSHIYAQAGTSIDEIEAMAHVYIIQPDGDEKIWKGAPTDYDLDKLARQHGSGSYRLKVYVKDDTNQYRLKLNKEFRYRLSAAEDANLRAIREGKMQPGMLGGNGAAMLTAESIATIVDARMKANAPAPVDPLAGAERIIGLFARLMPQQQALPASAPVNTMKETLDMARSIFAISRELSPPAVDGKAKPADQAMSRGVDLVARMFEKHIEGSAPAASAAIVSNPGELPDNLSDEEKEAIEMLRMALRMACRAAKNGVKAAEFADEHYEDISIETVAQLYADPQWFATLCANEPECKKYSAWFNEARTALITMAQDAGELDAAGQIVKTPEGGDPDPRTSAGTGGA